MSSEGEEEDSVTPKYSPILMGNEVDANNNHIVKNTSSKSYGTHEPIPPPASSRLRHDSCHECNLSNRRVPITCENDLYHRTSNASCKHDKQQQHTIRSSSALTYLEHNSNSYSRRQDLEFNSQPPPSKFTNALNSHGKDVIRPIAHKPIVSESRFYGSPTNQFFERHGSEINLGNSNGSIDAQRFGGSLCNVLTSSDLHLRREVSESLPYVGNTVSGRPEVPKHFLPNRSWYGAKKKTGLNSVMNGLELSNGGHSPHSPSMKEQKLRQPTHRILQPIRSEPLKVYANQEADTSHALWKELNDVRSQLDEAKWLLCHRTGEIGLLKARLKDSQSDQVTRCNEIVQLRASVKDLSSEISTLRGQLSQAVLSFRSKERENVVLKQKLSQQENGQKNECEENEFLRKQLNEIEQKYSLECSKWERQKKKWAEEQKRVLRYQKALQHNYLLTCQKAQTLAAQVESFSSISV